jgi:hypothetical protein
VLAAVLAAGIAGPSVACNQSTESNSAWHWSSLGRAGARMLYAVHRVLTRVNPGTAARSAGLTLGQVQGATPCRGRAALLNVGPEMPAHPGRDAAMSMRQAARITRCCTCPRVIAAAKLWCVNVVRRPGARRGRYQPAGGRILMFCATSSAVGLALLAAVSCGSSSGLASAAAHTAPASSPGGTTSASHPLRGIIALGHSALTGENSDPQSLGMPAPQNSWATGTNPAVDSIYQRLAAVDPAFRGHAVNAAFGGATAATLVGQATKALRVEPNPRLVIIEIIGTDIRCDGSDSSHYPVFGQQVKAALDLIARQAPHATILLVSWPGRPLQASKAITGTPAAQAQSGSGMCSPFDSSLRLDMKHITTWTGIIEGYESELAKVCATVPECHTDNGRATHFQVPASYYSSDWEHLNVTGLAALAAFMWPTVAKILNSH